MSDTEAFTIAVDRLHDALRGQGAFDSDARRRAIEDFVASGRALGHSDPLIRSLVGFAFDQAAGPMVSLRADALADVDALLGHGPPAAP
ncbi:MAG: hypothetical protein ACXW0Z_21105 [Gemmatirosa sp.]